MGPIYDSELDPYCRSIPVLCADLVCSNRTGPIYDSELDPPQLDHTYPGNGFCMRQSHESNLRSRIGPIPTWHTDFVRRLVMTRLKHNHSWHGFGMHQLHESNLQSRIGPIETWHTNFVHRFGMQQSHGSNLRFRIGLMRLKIFYCKFKTSLIP